VRRGVHWLHCGRSSRKTKRETEISKFFLPHFDCLLFIFVFRLRVKKKNLSAGDTAVALAWHQPHGYKQVRANPIGRYGWGRVPRSIPRRPPRTLGGRLPDPGWGDPSMRHRTPNKTRWICRAHSVARPHGNYGVRVTKPHVKNREWRTEENKTNVTRLATTTRADPSRLRSHNNNNNIRRVVVCVCVYMYMSY